MKIMWSLNEEIELCRRYYSKNYDNYDEDGITLHIINQKKEEKQMLTCGIAMWCSIQSPNTKFEPCWEVQVILTPEGAKRIEDQGLEVKKGEDGTLSFRPKRKLHKKDGTQNSPPKCVDEDNMPFTKLIGNGSLVNVQYHPYEWSNKFGSGMSADFAGIQVLEHVEYKGEDGDEFEPVSVEEKPVFTEDDDDLPFEK